MRTPLFFSVMKKDVESVKLFLRYRASLDHIDTNGKSLLDYAYESYDLEIVRLLVRHGVTLGKDGSKGKELLLCATMANDPVLVKYLVERDVPLTAQDSAVSLRSCQSGETAFMVALSMGSIQLFMTLLSYLRDSAALNIQDKKGQTLLMRAVNIENEEAVKALLKRTEVDLNKQDFVS